MSDNMNYHGAMDEELEVLEYDFYDEDKSYRDGYAEEIEYIPMEAEDLDLKSDEVNEVLGKPPHWIVRSGIMMVAVVTTLVLAGSYVVHYPDTLPTEVTIATESLPTSVKAKQSGKLTHLFIEEHEQVKKGQYLGVLENTVNYEDVLLVKNWFDDFKDQLFKTQKIGRAYIGKVPELGTMQSSFSALQKSYKDYQFYLSQAANERKIRQLQKQIAVQNQLSSSLTQKIKVNDQTFALTDKKFQGDKALYQEGIIAEQTYDDAEKVYLNEKLNLVNLSNEKANQQLQIEGLRQQIVELEQQTTERRIQLIDAIRQATINFDNQLTQWEENYVLKSAIDGKVAFYKFWTQNQEVQGGDEVMVVIPESKDLFAFSYLAAANSGKIKEGQKVRIELTDFPFQEYGYVYGTVTSKSDISRDGKYLLRIDMPEGLMTKYGVQLPFSQEMRGTGNIIIEDLRLLERFFKNFRGTFERFL